MAKPVFRSNFCRITNIYEKQKEEPKVKQKKIANTKQKDGRGVPAMPRMVFNRDGSPCYKHIEDEVATTTKRVKGKGGQEFYPAPRINWKES